MKYSFRFSGLVLFILLISVVNACKKEKSPANTPEGVPDATTIAAANITTTGVSLNGSVNANDLSTTVTFEYGTTNSYGGTIAAAQNPLSGDSITAVSASLTGLIAGTIYHFRVKAVNSLGTTYGKDLIFKTYNGTVTDIDGNVYYTIAIGVQTWMAENLKTTMYIDGTTIPLVTDASAWNKLSVPGYCWYNNNPGYYKATFGALYNWFTVNTGKLCPSGWHVPTDTEWTTLATYLGGVSVAGSKMKEAGTTHWQRPYEKIIEATNESGFTGLPGGFRDIFGTFLDIGVSGRWWAATETSLSWAWHWDLWYGSADVYRANYLKVVGYSVRCIKD